MDASAIIVKPYDPLSPPQSSKHRLVHIQSILRDGLEKAECFDDRLQAMVDVVTADIASIGMAGIAAGRMKPVLAFQKETFEYYWFGMVVEESLHEKFERALNTGKSKLTTVDVSVYHDALMKARDSGITSMSTILKRSLPESLSSGESMSAPDAKRPRTTHAAQGPAARKRSDAHALQVARPKVQPLAGSTEVGVERPRGGTKVVIPLAPAVLAPAVTVASKPSVPAVSSTDTMAKQSGLTAATAYSAATSAETDEVDLYGDLFAPEMDKSSPDQPLRGVDGGKAVEYVASGPSEVADPVLTKEREQPAQVYRDAASQTALSPPIVTGSPTRLTGLLKRIGDGYIELPGLKKSNESLSAELETLKKLVKPHSDKESRDRDATEAILKRLDALEAEKKHTKAAIEALVDDKVKAALHLAGTPAEVLARLSAVEKAHAVLKAVVESMPRLPTSNELNIALQPVVTSYLTGLEARSTQTIMETVQRVLAEAYAEGRAGDADEIRKVVGAVFEQARQANEKYVNNELNALRQELSREIAPAISLYETIRGAVTTSAAAGGQLQNGVARPGEGSTS